MRVKLVTSVPNDVTESDILQRLVKAVGMLVGLTAGFFLFALLTAGKANAEQDNGNAQPGLLGGVTNGLGDVVGAAVAPVARGAATAVEPVITPVTEAVAPITRPVLAPVTRALSPVLSDVSGVVKPVTEPLLGSVVRAVDSVVKPVNRAIAAEPVVEAVTGPESPGASRSDREPRHSPDTDTGWPDREAQPVDSPVVESVTPPLSLQHHGVTGHADTRPADIAPAHKVDTGFSLWTVKPAPSAPPTPPSGPAATGAPGGVTNAPHGPGADGSTVTGTRVLPRPVGSWGAASGMSVGPSWWTSYGRHHPS
ncbi:hypothetical protein H4W33_006422 [Kibdelosporangium phytohabitans]|nr:hypothetical protein [Kibdelosporangium phytohabitans]